LAASLVLLKQRAAIIRAVRGFFHGLDFFEVETPIRLPACLPEAHIELQESGDWFLQASPELCMKRLLASGAEAIFQICPCFRKHERGQRHLPEMTLLEWYRTAANYHSLMDDCEAMLTLVARQCQTGGPLNSQGQRMDLSAPWPRLSLKEAFARHASVDLQTAMLEDRFEEILTAEVEPCLGLDQPIFLYEYPASMASLARLRADQPQLAERFELYVNGIELANGFSELNDPDEQRQRFDEERRLITSMGRQVGPMPEPFLADLRQMPEAAGIAMGLDRLVMLFTGSNSIEQVVSFTPEDL